jgi:hypothetical protein
MNKKLVLSVVFSVIAYSSFAQYEEDALRFSQNFIGGTARIIGMAGAQQALGADISSLTGNPAGLGFYRKSDFSISPTLRFNTTESSVYNTLSSERRDNFNIGSVGFSIAQVNQDYTGRERQQGWVSQSFAFSYSRKNNYYEDRYFQGNNVNNGSITQYFAQLANAGDTASIFDGNINTIEDMAWNGYMIDYDSTSTFIGLSSGNNTQSQIDRIEGSQNEWSFGFGANYSNKLYLGASLGISSVRYEQTTKFNESKINDPTYNLQDVQLNERLNVEGNSVNFRIGTIFRPIDLIRIGLSLQSPDYYNFDERFSTDASSRANGTGYSFSPLDYFFQYRLRTPFKYQGGLAFFLNKYAIISGDVEFMDYSSNRLSAQGINSDFGPQENANMNNLYQNTMNYRLGAELKFGDLALRAGYANYGDPYRNPSYDQSRQFITAGLGYRYINYYVDFAFSNQQYTSKYSPYFLDAGNEPVVTTTHTINSLILTLGTRF